MRRILPFVLACNPLANEVQLQGVLTDGPDGTVWTEPASLTVRSLPDGVEQASAEAREGLYRVAAPAGVGVFLEASGPGLVTASFTGVTGLSPRLRIADGEVYVITTQAMDDWELRFAGCPGVGQQGAVFGEVRVIDLTNDDGEHPTINSAWARLADADGEDVGTPCYLDEEGTGWDPDATRTGPAGAFALFGIPGGSYLLEVGYDIGGGQTATFQQELWVPDGGVAPRLPMWVEFELPG